jgi:hypothetical protein
MSGNDAVFALEDWFASFIDRERQGGTRDTLQVT